MAQPLDFSAIKKECIVKVAERLNLGLKPGKKANNYRGSCPKCKGSDRQFSVTGGADANGFRCWGCDAKGDCISLVSLVQGGTLRDAARWIIGEQAHEPEKSAGAHTPTNGMKPLDYLQADHELVAEIGFPEAVAKAVGIGWAPRGLHKKLVAIPIRLPDGKLIGYVGVDECKLPDPDDWKL